MIVVHGFAPVYKTTYGAIAADTKSRIIGQHVMIRLRTQPIPTGTCVAKKTTVGHVQVSVDIIVDRIVDYNLGQEVGIGHGIDIS